jgi:hypothetical protein
MPKCYGHTNFKSKKMQGHVPKLASEIPNQAVVGELPTPCAKFNQKTSSCFQLEILRFYFPIH